MTLRAPGLPRALLSLLVTLAPLCAACGAPGIVPWPDGAVAVDAPADAPDTSPDAPPPDAVAVGDSAADGAADASSPMDAPDAVAVGDAQEDVPGLEVAADVTDANPFSSMGDAADVTGPSPLAQHLDHVEVWQSVNGAPLAPVSGTCSDLRAVVTVRAPAARISYVYSPPGLPNSNAIRCPGGGVEWNDNRATYEYLSPYGMPGGVIRSNLRFVGRIHAGACDDGPETRVEVYAFGCPVM